MRSARRETLALRLELHGPPATAPRGGRPVGAGSAETGTVRI